MKAFRHSLIAIIVLTLGVLTLPSMNALADSAAPAVNTPAELGVQDTKDRTSYDTALTQLNDFMRAKQAVLSYEDAVDHFQVYKDKVSRQEIGETIFHMYSKVGPRPAKKYFGDREIEAEKAAAAVKAQQAAQAQAAAAAAAQAQTKAQATAAARTTPAPAPTPVYSPAPTGARTGAICRDGTPSTATGSGACSHHGGVDHWLYN